MSQLEAFLLERHDLSLARKTQYRQAFKALAKYTQVPFGLSREQMNQCLDNMAKDYMDQSWNELVSCIRVFYKWQNGGEYPESVKHVKRKPINRLEEIESKIVSEKDVKALLRATMHPRDRAFIAVAYATGLRRGALVKMRIRDVESRLYGFDVLGITGKTFTLQPPVIVGEFAKILSVWLEHHPFRLDSDAPLWIRLHGKPGGINERQADEIMSKAVKAAGLGHKGITLHCLRHSAATWHAKHGITEAELRILFGWTEKSSTPSIYVHLNKDDAKNASLRAHGIVKQPEQEKMFEPVVCAYCGEENPSTSIRCKRCYTILNLEEAEKLLERQQAMEKAFSVLGDLSVWNGLKAFEQLIKNDPQLLERLRKLKHFNLSL